MNDGTEAVRRAMVAEINAEPNERATLEAEHGQVWNTAEMQADFDVTGFLAPFVVVIRKDDGKRGTLTFSHYPRFYWGFKAEG